MTRPGTVTRPSLFACLLYYGGDGRERLVEAALDGTFDSEKWYRTGTIADMAGVSEESVRRHVSRPDEKPPVLTEFGIYVVKDRDVVAPHYTVGDTEVIELCQSWDGPVELVELLGGKTGELVEWFILQSDHETGYSLKAIEDGSGLNYRTVEKYIETLVESGLVTDEESSGWDRYQLDIDSETYDFLATLEDAIMCRVE